MAGLEEVGLFRRVSSTKSRKREDVEKGEFWLEWGSEGRISQSMKRNKYPQHTISLPYWISPAE